ncbi:hypothetical protein L7F22_045928 [Adiantum nelumboides]|nr:hypothetical protein [Adiantum nelumboides]
MAPIEGCDVILGMPWHYRIHPIPDFVEKTLTLPVEDKKIIVYADADDWPYPLTIIESLKHACTGELPPNARAGQSFVHDPKVAGETEVKGQIKLRFKTAAGKDVVCIRSFQLTQKGTKLEYKAIESVLQTIDPLSGEKVCLSYRCADMDREVPALMGVSKAILENVIFVHQDEANWPLADGATLKKKFDDIFSATK